MPIILKAILITAGIGMGFIAIKAHKNCGRDNGAYKGTIIKADTVYVGNRIILKFKFS